MQPTKRLDSGWALVVLAAVVGQLLWLPGVLAEPQYVTVLHFNDSHGELLPFEQDGESVGGIARMATMVDQTRRWNQPHGVATLLLNAGDVLQGTPLSTVFHGEPDFLCLNLMDLDGMTIGNHEFDFGQDNLAKLMKLTQFPVLSANVCYANTDRLLAPSLIKQTLGTEEVIIFGLTTPETTITTHPRNVRGLKFADPIATARQIIEQYRGQVDFFIAVTHLGKEADIQLAQAVPEIDVIVGGHSHDALERPMKVGNTLICQAGSRGIYLGQVDMLVEDGDIIKWRGFLRPVDGSNLPHPAVAAVVEHYASRLGRDLEQVIATAQVTLNGKREAVRSHETNLGNLLTDIAREYAQADVALLNGGGIRDSISRGPVAIKDVLKVLPFGNQLATVDLTGQQLLAVLEFDAALPRPAGGFLQVSGLNLVIDGDKVSEVTVGGKPLQPDKTYRVATNDFLLAGGDGYSMLARGQNATYVGSTLSSIVIDALKARGQVTAAVEGRITIK